MKKIIAVFFILFITVSVSNLVLKLIIIIIIRINNIIIQVKNYNVTTGK